MKNLFLVLLVATFSAHLRAEPVPAKMFNVRTNPLNYLLSDINVDIDVRLFDRVTVGPYISLMKTTAVVTASGSTTSQNVDYTFFMTGGRFNFYLTGTAISDSLYLSPIIGYANFKITDPTTAASGSLPGLNLGAFVGYQWVWESGINISTGIGFNSYLMGSTLTMSNGQLYNVPSYALILPNLDVTIGFAF